MDPFELLQVSMVEDDKPLEMDNEANTTRANALFDNYPSVTISEEEFEYYRLLFADIESVKYKKIHCTACNIHMGTAPVAQQNRFEHPLLKVLICEQCFKFYSSGDFEKDADGSELYCRWCGQGGQVYCCARCPFVFCKKCIQRNIGRSMVSHIDSSDDWLCYACNPRDIWMLRGLNWAITKYSAMKMLISPEDRTEKDEEDIITDYSMCCKDKTGTKHTKSGLVRPGPSHKKSTKDDKKGPINHEKARSISPLDGKILVPKVERLNLPSPVIESKKPIKLTILKQNSTKTKNSAEKTKHMSNNTSKSSKLQDLLSRPNNSDNMDEDEVVCTPDIIAIDDESPPTTPVKPPKAQKQQQYPKLTPKTSFLQVKPPSKLIDQSKKAEPKVTYKAVPIATNLQTVNFQTLQNNPVVSGMIQNLQKQVKPGEPQKIIKIVSPDGRAFLIDPMKIPPNTNDPNVIFSQAATPVPAAAPPPPLHMLAKPPPNTVMHSMQQQMAMQPPRLHPTVWFDNGINGLHKISQVITNIIVSLVNDQKNFMKPNWMAIYNNFQGHLKILLEHVEQLRLQVKTEYLHSVSVGETNPKRRQPPKDTFGQHFLSFVADSYAPPLAETMQPPPNLLNPAMAPMTLVLNPSPVLNQDIRESLGFAHQNNINNPVTNIINDFTQPNDPAELIPENRENDQPVPTDETEQDMIDPKDLLETTLEEGDETITTEKLDKNEKEPDEEKTDEQKIEELKKRLAEMQKELAKRKKKEAKKPAKKQTEPDEIFDVDVTCDSDEEEEGEEAADDDNDEEFKVSENESSDETESIYSIKSSASDSDCILVSDSEASKKKVRRKNRSRAESETGSQKKSNVDNEEKTSNVSDTENSESKTDEQSKKRKRSVSEDDSESKRPKLDEDKNEEQPEKAPDTEDKVTEETEQEADKDKDETVENNQPEEEEKMDVDEENGTKEPESEKGDEENSVNQDQSSNNDETQNESDSEKGPDDNENADTTNEEDTNIKENGDENVSNENETTSETENQNESTTNNSDSVSPNKSSTKEDSSIFNCINSYVDFVSIANAIRESIIESQGTTTSRSGSQTKRKKQKDDDLEKLLSSNVVFKKSETSKPETENNPSTSASTTSGPSFGDAFSNFVATVAEDDECPEMDADEFDELAGSVENGAHNSIKETLLTENSTAELDDSFPEIPVQTSQPDKPTNDEIDLESEMVALQKLAENCIAESSTENASAATEN